MVTIFGCQNNRPEQTEVVSPKSEFNTIQKHSSWIVPDGKVLKKIDNWQEYRTLSEFINQYESISPNEALNNSRELNNLVKSMKDSIKPKFLESAAFDARINHLHNETLRLYDMSSISSIKSDEVHTQVGKVLDAFSAMNLKMNTMVRQKELDKQVDDPNFKRVLKDSVSEPKEPEQKLQLSPRQKKMQLSKEERLKKRKFQLQTTQQKQNEKKKNN
jgi:hypothetical protein